MLLFLALSLPFLLVLLGMPRFIGWLKAKAYGQTVREDGPQHHAAKQGTPTAGGVVLLASWLVFQALALWLEPVETHLTLVVLGVTLLLGLLGLADDGLKIYKKHNKGVNAYTKLAVQALAGFGLWWAMQTLLPKSWVALNPWLWLAPVVLTVMTFSNAVNLTDGLDGLAGGSVGISLLTLAILLQDHHPGLSLCAVALASATMGFWWFNRRPAQIFMGDAGSLALGGALASLALLGEQAQVLPWLGALYLIETASVVLQVASFKLTGKRVFKMSPLHHHFELCGWPEAKVVAAFTGFQAVCCAGVLFYSYAFV